MKFKQSNIYILENVFSLVSVKSIDLGIAIFLIPYLIYKVGLQNYGIYAFSISLILYLVNIINYSFDFTVVRELAVHSKKKKIQIVYLTRFLPLSYT